MIYKIIFLFISQRRATSWFLRKVHRIGKWHVTKKEDGGYMWRSPLLVSSLWYHVTHIRYDRTQTSDIIVCVYKGKHTIHKHSLRIITPPTKDAPWRVFVNGKDADEHTYSAAQHIYALIA